VNCDLEAWERIEAEGLGGFTGVTPVRKIDFAPSSSAPPGLPQHDSAGRAKFIGQSKMFIKKVDVLICMIR